MTQQIDWLDIHRSCSDTAKESTQGHRALKWHQSSKEATGVEFFKLYVTSCGDQCSYVWTSIFRGWKYLGGWLTGSGWGLCQRCCRQMKRIKELVLIPGPRLGVWQLFDELSKKAASKMQNSTSCCKPVVTLQNRKHWNTPEPTDLKKSLWIHQRNVDVLVCKLWDEHQGSLLSVKRVCLLEPQIWEMTNQTINQSIDQMISPTKTF